MPKVPNLSSRALMGQENFSEDPKQEVSSEQILDMDTIKKIMQVLKKKN